jgi:hypothetical protein
MRTAWLTLCPCRLYWPLVCQWRKITRRREGKEGQRRKGERGRSVGVRPRPINRSNQPPCFAEVRFGSSPADRGSIPRCPAIPRQDSWHPGATILSLSFSRMPIGPHRYSGGDETKSMRLHVTDLIRAAAVSYLGHNVLGTTTRLRPPTATKDGRATLSNCAGDIEYPPTAHHLCMYRRDRQAPQDRCATRILPVVVWCL